MSMQAIVLESHGGIDLLRFRTMAKPLLKGSDVRIKILACGCNHLDVWVRRGVPGHRFPLPLIPGSDVVGVVEAVGEDVSDLTVGEHLWVAPALACGRCTACALGRDHHCRSYAILGEHRDGGYASHITVPRYACLPMPKGWSTEEVAGLGVSGLTAWNMVHRRARVKPDEVVLVQGASGGVGAMAIQLVQQLGGRAIAVVSSPAKADFVAQFSPAHIIDTSRDDMLAAVKAYTQGAGAAVVLDSCGEASWESSLNALAWRGRLVVCGATAGHKVALDLRRLFFKEQSLLGATMGSRGDLFALAEHIQQKKLQPIVGQVLPFSETGKAHTLIENREVIGKIILRW